MTTRRRLVQGSEDIKQGFFLVLEKRCRLNHKVNRKRVSLVVVVVLVLLRAMAGAGRPLGSAEAWRQDESGESLVVAMKAKGGWRDEERRAQGLTHHQDGGGRRWPREQTASQPKCNSPSCRGCECRKKRDGRAPAGWACAGAGARWLAAPASTECAH